MELFTVLQGKPHHWVEEDCLPWPAGSTPDAAQITITFPAARAHIQLGLHQDCQILLLLSSWVASSLCRFLAPCRRIWYSLCRVIDLATEKVLNEKVVLCGSQVSAWMLCPRVIKLPVFIRCTVHYTHKNKWMANRCSSLPYFCLHLSIVLEVWNWISRKECAVLVCQSGSVLGCLA